MSQPSMTAQGRRHRGAPPTPNGAVRTFGEDETIVTKTDLKGHITYANDVFLRVSAYTEDEVLGQPHNLIRHPDMPAGVFKLLWQRLEAGQEIFAYVLNLAGDGVAYWVFAHVTPTLDPSGRPVAYHSTRRMVPPAVIEAVADVYRAVRHAERGLRSARDAAGTGLDTLSGIAAGQGLDFDQWTWSLAAAQLSHSKPVNRLAGNAPSAMRLANRPAASVNRTPTLAGAR